MRFFDQRSMRELGLALGISEDAAKMRVSRAMEHLRGLFGERGVACGATVLTASLAQRAVEAAPAGLMLSLAALRIQPQPRSHPPPPSLVSWRKLRKGNWPPGSSLWS
jgi:hypothetical protein